MNKPLRAVLVLEADEVTTKTSNKPMPRVPGPYAIFIVHDNFLTILEGGREISNSNDRTTEAPGPNKSRHVSSNI